MKRSGRISPFVVVGIVCILILIPLFLVSKRGPEVYAAEFMTALGQGDAKTLADLSVIGSHNLEERQKLWQDSIDSSKYYTFSWRISDVSTLSDDRAAVTLQMRRNLQLRMGEDETKYMLPLVKVDDKWKVPVDQMDRDIYPFLPRP